MPSPLLPADPLTRARQRAWIAFAATPLDDIARLYSVPQASAFEQQAARLEACFRRLETELSEGPWFAGRAFGLVDAVFAPVFRYFEVFKVFEAIAPLAILRDKPRVAVWRRALAARSSVIAAVGPDYGGSRVSASSRSAAATGSACASAGD